MESTWRDTRRHGIRRNRYGDTDQGQWKFEISLLRHSYLANSLSLISYILNWAFLHLNLKSLLSFFVPASTKSKRSCTRVKAVVNSRSAWVSFCTIITRTRTRESPRAFEHARTIIWHCCSCVCFVESIRLRFLSRSSCAASIPHSLPRCK